MALRITMLCLTGSLLASAGCGDDDDGSPDAPSDAAAADAAAPQDGGSPPDTGSPPDGGSPPDSGSPPDAAEPPDDARPIDGAAPDAAVTYALGGTLGGLLGGTVELTDGVETLALGADGPFEFARRLPAGAAYEVTVSSQPAGQACAVVAGSGAGTVTGEIPPVVVTCALAADAYEDNDLPADAHVVQLATTYPDATAGGLDDPDDHYRVALLDEGATAAWDLTATIDVGAVLGATDGVLTLAILSPDGAEILADSFVVSAPGARTLTAPLSSGTPADEFVVAIRASDPGAGYLYALTLTRTAATLPVADCSRLADPFDPNDDVAHAAPIPLDAPIRAGLCTPADTMDAFAFTIPPGDPLKVTATLRVLDGIPDSAGGSLGFFKASGEQYFSVGTSSATGAQASVAYTFNPGDYVVHHDVGPSTFVSIYELALATGPGCADDPFDLPPNDDDFPAGAFVLAPGSRSFVGCMNDRDHRLVQMVAPGRFWVRVTADPGQYVWIVLSTPAGAVCASDGGTEVLELSCDAPQPGIYRAWTMNMSFDGAYTVRLIVE